MEPSPLTQQTRPDVFEPKVVGLYRKLFQDAEAEEKSEGFWRELFLLRPELPRLREIVDISDPDFLLHQRHQTQDLVRHAISCIQASEAPSDENALDILTVFFAIVLGKKYTNPSSDVIEVLAGLDDVDTVILQLVTTLDQIIRDGRTMTLRQKAVKTAIAVVSGGYQTALVSDFINKDFFPASIKLVQQLDNPLQASDPLLLLGLLANYGKFEVHNQYHIRFADFVNDNGMKHIVDSVSWICTLLRQRYVVIQDDTPATWSIGSTLSYVGLGGLARTQPTSAPLTENEQRELFRDQPGLEAASLITLYDFTIANRLFCQHFISQTCSSKDEAPPLSNFLSFTSYLFQHAYRTQRSSTYAYLTSLILLVLVEDVSAAKLLCETNAPVRLCRQRSPLLPLAKSDRSYIIVILDILTDGINHNLRKRLDCAFYTRLLEILSRSLSHLAKLRSKLPHHWSEIWRSLLAFLRFLTTYSDDLRSWHGIGDVVNHLVDLLAFAMHTGEAFLPDATSYDDLLYKIVESGEVLAKLRDLYNVAKPDDKSATVNSLIGVSKHYQELIETQRAKSKVLSTHEVAKVIKQGYETLNFDVAQGSVERVERFREAGHRNELKRITRFVVQDAAALVVR